MQDAQIYTIIALALYALTMAVIGCISFRKSKTLDGFLVGGRRIGAWSTAFAYGSAYFSAVVFIGYAGQHGWNIGIGAIWIGIGNTLIGCPHVLSCPTNSVNSPGSTTSRRSRVMRANREAGISMTASTVSPAGTKTLINPQSFLSGVATELTLSLKYA